MPREEFDRRVPIRRRANRCSPVTLDIMTSGSEQTSCSIGGSEPQVPFQSRANSRNSKASKSSESPPPWKKKVVLKIVGPASYAPSVGCASRKSSPIATFRYDTIELRSLSNRNSFLRSASARACDRWIGVCASCSPLCFDLFLHRRRSYTLSS
jgi:hypothetical protein